MEFPEYLTKTFKKLTNAGFEAYAVGGCVRDILMNKLPNDWDIATNARPDEILGIFPEAKYENEFGTVILPIKDRRRKTLQVLEITTYRSEKGYTDKRHPDEINFEDSLEKDLERRDFTVNAMAVGKPGKDKPAGGKKSAAAEELEKEGYHFVDIFGGRKDIKKKMIRAVGEPVDRFKEDALRMMRAVRFASQLGFMIEPKTERAIAKMAGSLKFIAKERVRGELVKILGSPDPYSGILELYKLKLLNYIIPELLAAKGMKQNHHHIYTVWRHSLLSLKYCPSRDWRVRLAALLHDIGKPRAREEKNGQATFYNHEYIGAKMAKKIMLRLKFSSADTEKVVNLVRNHMFYYNTEEVTAASVRRLIRKVGKENLKDLIDMRIGDRLGSGVKKAKPYKLRHLEYMFERVQNDPVSVKMLKIGGDRMIKEMGMEPGPKMGAVLDILLSEVIDNKNLNNLEYLEKRAKELYREDVERLREKAKEQIEEKRQKDDKKLKKQHWVK